MKEVRLDYTFTMIVNKIPHDNSFYGDYMVGGKMSTKEV